MTMIGTRERAAQLAADLVAVAVGEAEVEQHEIVLGRREASAAFATHVTSNPSRRSPVASGSAIASSSSTSKTRMR